jgi:hypothetical protein
LLFSFSLSIAQNAPSGYADTSFPSSKRSLSPDFQAGCAANFTVFRRPRNEGAEILAVCDESDQ